MKKKMSLGLMSVIFLTSTAYGYRFICNGLVANGAERIDPCGMVCDAEHAARWASPNVEVLVDYRHVPKSLTSSEWQSTVEASLAAWENVSGANLKFLEVQGENAREFGGNDALHEVFWITNKDEWRLLVGSGEFATLGATIPRYTCGDTTLEKRTIYDADLALNGLPHINWQINCDNEDCISPQTTLVHELGHFFGLDHPCDFCSTSIMSARAGFDITYPLLDDMDGLRALYPDGSTGGSFTPCNKDQDCQDKSVCTSDGERRYCAPMCASNSSCKSGTVCKDSVCKFVNEDVMGGGKEGDNCMKNPCDEPLVCAGADKPHFYCTMPCETLSDCHQGQACVQLKSEPMSVCVNIRNRGDRCDHKNFCDNELYCVFDTPHRGFCRLPCQSTSSNDTGCPKDEACQLFAEEGAEICMPIEQTGLQLDDSSDEFAANVGDDRFGRNAKPKKAKPKASGCQSIALDKANDISWGASLLLVLWWMNFLRSRRKVH